MGVVIRKRKWQPVGSSVDYDYETGHHSIEYFMALKDEYRQAAGNRIPVPWPYVPSKASTAFKSKVESTRPQWTKILKDYKINILNIHVQGLGRRGIANTTKDTLVISTHDENAQYWNAAATDILKVLAMTEIRVEIRNYDRMYRDVSYSVKANTPAHNALKLVQPLVLAQAKKLFPNLWKIISFVLRGPNDDASNLAPTVLITIDPGMKNLWNHVQDQMLEAIAKAQTEVEVFLEIVPDLFYPGAEYGPEPVPEFTLWSMPLAAPNGASIGPRASTNAGTMGIWMWFQPKDGPKFACFLTSYHVIAEGEGTGRAANDANGIGLNGSTVPHPITVDYPAVCDMKATRKRHLQEIKDGKDTNGAFTKLLQTIDKYESQGGIGNVVHASGIKRKLAKGNRADWAIVKLNSAVPHTVSRPPPATFTKQQMGNGYWKYEGVKEGEAVTKFGHFQEGEWVAKIGRTTDNTTADVNCMAASFNDGSGGSIAEVELMSIPPGGFFVEPGDYGSMVLNIEKECVGMIFGGAGGGNRGYATPIQDIVDDIFATTGGKLTLIT